MALSDYSGVVLRRSDPLVKRLIEATFPSYNGRKIKARLWTHPKQLNNYWDGGSRSYYKAVRISDSAIADFDTDNPFLQSAHDKVDLPPGVILVEHVYFQGHDLGLTVWMRSEAVAQIGPGIDLMLNA